MAGWFDRILNPAWYKIYSLEAQEAFELSLVVLLHGAIRFTLRDELVIPFQKLSEPNVPDEILNGSFGPLIKEIQKRWPISDSILERLVDECEIGMLKCYLGTSLSKLPFKVLNPDTIIDGVGVLALSEINHRLGRKEPCVLTKTDYSEDPEECRVQVLLTWMRVVGLQYSQFPRLYSELFFAEKWKNLSEHLLDGFVTAINRNSRGGLLNRVEKECKQLSSAGTEIIMALADTIKRRRINS